MADRIERFRGAFPLPDPAATETLAARIAAGLRPGCVVALKGELGTGKTTLARAILRAMGVSEHVPSPTFTLVQSYDTAQGMVFHFDLYRVRDARELDELGFDEALDQGIVLMEWPERAEGRSPSDMLTVALAIDSGGRSATVSGDIYWEQFLAEEKQDV